MRAALKMHADAADKYNTEFLPFTVGEEATHQMQKTFSHLLDLIGAYQAIGRPPPLE